MRIFLGNLSIVFALCFMYAGVYMYVAETSDKNAHFSDTYISKVQAKLKFYEDKNTMHNYGDATTNFGDRELELYSDKWSSAQYPLPGTYTAASITSEEDIVVTKDVLSAAKTTITITH